MLIDLRARVNGNGSLWLPLFLDFISKLKIKSKELVEPGPIIPYGAQELFLQKLCDGLDDDCHFFVALKARQLGMTTIMLALDLFWLSMFPGLEGALIMDTDSNLQNQRSLIAEMLNSLPRAYKLKVVKNNRNFLELANGSRLQYLSAGTRASNKTFGVSRAYSFVHASEVGTWGDQDAVAHLTTTLAEHNPNRLYIFESTAFGFNGFETLYKEGCDDGISKRAMFIGWWAKEDYAWAQGSREYDRHWGEHPRFTPEEKQKIRIVKQLYNFEVTDEQIAWYRSRQSLHSDTMLAEKFPWYADEAFVATGHGFFSPKKLTEDLRIATKIAPKHYTFQLGATFMDAEIKPARKPEDADLRIWSEPRRGGLYVMGADPAYGSSEDSDRTAISVWRAYADKLLQVAEYATNEPTSSQAAWVIAYLCACYESVRVNIELNGPGEATMREIQYLKQQMILPGAVRAIAHEIKAESALAKIQWFLDRKVETSGGGWAYNFRTNQRNKITMLNQFRDGFSSDMAVVRSVPLLEEMKHIQQDGDHIAPAAKGRDKDDRVIAAALAYKTWADNLRTGLMARNLSFENVTRVEQERDAALGPTDPGAIIVQTYFSARRQQNALMARQRFRRGI